MVKTQVQLPEDDLRELKRVAAEEGISVSELVRRGVKRMLDERRKPSRAELWERASRAIGKFRSGGADISQRHDDYLAEAYSHDLR